jgi:murein DD-endopeptidase MepM/ murein hydrolase activator NlpD
VTQPVGGGGGGGGPEGAAAAAKAMEAYFLRRVLGEVQRGDALTGGGLAGSTFNDMFNEALADAMSEAGGVGLAQQLVDQIAPGTGVAAGAGPRSSAYADLPVFHGPSPIAHAPTSTGSVIGRYQGGGAALSVMPVTAHMTSGIGPRTLRDGSHNDHKGVDLAVPLGTPVVAAGGGTVVRAEQAGGYGNLVVVDHGGGLETRYAHLSEFHVKEGDVVHPGQVLALSGSTGNSRGPHLHFEVRRDGEVMDPTKEIQGLGKKSTR